MGLAAHHKISATISILILMCTFGLRAIRAQDTVDLHQPEITEAIIEEIKPEDLEVDLERAETKDGQDSEIVKQIRKLNADGSYTVGYEADDGTFKIESRDVLGNVKANNETGLKSDSHVEETTVTPRRHKGTPTTRRPQYSSSTASPTRPSVIQTIPRRLRVSTTAGTDRMNKDSVAKPSVKSDSTTTVIYATSVPTPKPYVNIRPTPLPGTNMRQAEQLARPDKLEINQGSKIQVTSPKEASTTKPVVEEVDEKEEVTLPYHTNLLRRQLMPDADTQYDTQHQIIYNSQADDDVRNLYGTMGSTARPLFTTTSSPRIPPVILAARQRAAQIQNSISANNAPTTEKYYIKSSRRQESPEAEPTTESTSENTYLTQSPIPVQIPATRDEGKRILRRPIQRPHFIRVLEQHSQPQQQVPTLTASGYEAPRLVRIPAEPSAHRVDPNEQYLRETTSPPKTEQIAEQEPIPARIPQVVYRNPVAAPQASQYYSYPEQEAPIPYPTHPIPYPPPQPQYYDYLDRPPLTTRDFEKLLQALIFRHQQIQQRVPYSGYNSRPYYPYNSDPYSPYPVFATRPPPAYLPYRTPIPAYADADGMYQAQSPISTAETPMSYELQRLMTRKKQYTSNPRYFGSQQAIYASEGAYSATAPPTAGGANGYLPPEVREELLYRMLMLALQSEVQQRSVAAPIQVAAESDSEASTTTKSSLVYKKPVRSVQILGEEQ
ncbi:fibrous sheath CABYR-binding protein-like isoform X2 [Hermetia illucens]|uniref:fibrous sheath CABYR-binding protein-like isoform X2 n=1 Tax=Hermetia illucens TaxID=343691 RepID=UPI0018CC5DE0|nr:fibrous sheath CABYR-binding protein-like isoform X2 [Hermetia illucens]